MNLLTWFVHCVLTIMLSPVVLFDCLSHSLCPASIQWMFGLWIIHFHNYQMCSPCVRVVVINRPLNWIKLLALVSIMLIWLARFKWCSISILGICHLNSNRIGSRFLSDNTIMHFPPSWTDPNGLVSYYQTPPHYKHWHKRVCQVWANIHWSETKTHKSIETKHCDWGER